MHFLQLRQTTIESHYCLFCRGSCAVLIFRWCAISSPALSLPTQSTLSYLYPEFYEQVNRYKVTESLLSHPTPKPRPLTPLSHFISIAMYISKKPIQLTTAFVFIICVSIFRHYNYSGLIQYHIRAGGHEKESLQNSFTSLREGSGFKEGLVGPGSITALSRPSRSHLSNSEPGGSNYSRVLVIPCLNEMEADWVKIELPDLELVTYVVNDTGATLYAPRNKGHEVMVYLSYIIDHYTDLPDIAVFMHAHRWAPHNNELLNYDAVEMIKRLSGQHVLRQGYVNMRCRWEPGCPEYLHPTNKQETLTRQEEMMASKCWAELFPLEALPPFLAQACCAQFALSRERILSIPLSQFIYYRDWVLTTPVSDYISGRIWEYLWHFIFTGNTSYCPAEYRCYCETYGICFAGEGPFEDFKKLRHQKEDLESQLEVSTEATSHLPRFELKNIGVATKSPSALIDQARFLDDKLAESMMIALKVGDERRQRAKVSGQS